MAAGISTRHGERMSGPAARRPKPCKLPRGRLLTEVSHRLEELWSPDEIARRLPLDFPDDPEMREREHQRIASPIPVQEHNDLATVAWPTRSSPRNANEDRHHQRTRTSRWDCAGQSNAPTAGFPTTVNETQTARPSTASLSSPSPSHSYSPPSSSTGETAGHQPQHQSAESLSWQRDIRWGSQPPHPAPVPKAKTWKKPQT